MPRLITWLTVPLLLLLAKPLIGQSTVGTQFWLGYMENLNLQFNDDPVFTISVVADLPTNGTVTVPVTGLSLNFSVPAGVTEVDLFNAILYSAGSDIFDNKGLRITTDAPVRVFAHHYRSFFSESTLLLPEPELGTNYLITTPMDVENNGQPNSFVVVATQDNTTVQITPTAVTLGLFPPDLPITITLNEGENYQVQSFGDLSGSSVISLSGQRLAVFAGAREANINAYCFDSANSHVWDQQLPLSRFGNVFHFVPFLSMNGDGIKILAQNDDTEVFFDCEFEVLLDAGESYFVARNLATVVSSTGPISLWQYNDEGGCNAGNLGDPNGINYLPAELRSTEYGWFASDRNRAGAGAAVYFTAHAATIIVPTSVIASVSLDGSLLPAANFSLFPGDPNFSYAQETLTGGAHFISAPEPVQVYAYGFNEFDAYTMSLGYSEEVSINYVCGCDPGSSSHQIVADPIGCVGDTTTLTLSYDYPNVGAWYWVIEGDTIFDETFVEEYVFSAPGIYSVEVVILTIDNCQYSETIQVEVTDCPDPCLDEVPTLTVNTPAVACVDSTVQLSLELSGNVSPLENVVWIPLSGGTPVSGQDIELTFELSGIYNYAITATLENGCSYQDTFAVTIINCADPCSGNELTLTFSPADPVCAGSSFNIMLLVEGNTVPINIILWTPTGEGDLLAGTSVTVAFDNPGIYEYVVEVTLQNGCQYSELLFLEVPNCTDECLVNEPDFEFYQDEPACANTLVDFGLRINGNVSPVASITWQALTLGGVQMGADLEEIFTSAGAYSYNVTVLLENGCDYTIEYVISVVDCPLANDCDSDPPELFPSVSVGRVCLNETFRLLLDITNLNGRSIDSVVWRESTTGLRSLGQNISVISLGAARILSFEVAVFLADSCVYEEELIVEIGSCAPDCAYYWPSAFSPNLDGVNDVFKPAYAPNCQPTEYLFQIFDRWGEIVFETNDPDTGWDGISRGQAMNPAVFVYQATFRNPRGNLVQEAGEFTLLR